MLISIIDRVVRTVRSVAELIDSEVFPRFVQLFTNRDSACQMSTILLSGLTLKHAPATLRDTTLAYQVLVIKTVGNSVLVLGY